MITFGAGFMCGVACVALCRLLFEIWDYDRRKPRVVGRKRKGGLFRL
jgi:hypothetical protein